MTRLYKALAAAAIALSSLNATSLAAKDIQSAVLAGGCFWCVEADMDKLDGVIETVSGFTGGNVPNVTYKQVTSGGTGHYEAVKVTFDADKITYAELLDYFLRSIDPLDAGGQFCDRGESYRSAIFATSPMQTQVAQARIAAASKALGTKVVTPVKLAGPFYLADSYHQDYYKQSKIVLTRFGPITKARAYEKYRAACGRDARVKAIWGAEKFPPAS